GKAPSPRALRLEVEAEALTALAMALTWGFSPGEPAEARPGPNRSRTQISPSGVSEVSPAELRVFGAELTKTLRMRRKTIEKAAARLSVSPAEVTRWAAGEDLPSEPQARLLDEYLTARGAIQNLGIELLSR